MLTTKDWPQVKLAEKGATENPSAVMPVELIAIAFVPLLIIVSNLVSEVPSGTFPKLTGFALNDVKGRRDSDAIADELCVAVDRLCRHGDELVVECANRSRAERHGDVDDLIWCEINWKRFRCRLNRVRPSTRERLQFEAVGTCVLDFEDFCWRRNRTTADEDVREGHRRRGDRALTRDTSRKGILRTSSNRQAV
jgi:hypothetical protein